MTAREDNQVAAPEDNQVTAREDNQVTAREDNQVTAREDNQVTALEDSRLAAIRNLTFVCEAMERMSQRMEFMLSRRANRSDWRIDEVPDTCYEEDDFPSSPKSLDVLADVHL